MELSDLVVIWQKEYAFHVRREETDFIRFALMVSSQYLVTKHPLIFGQMAARIVDLRGDDGAFDIAMKYAW